MVSEAQQFRHARSNTSRYGLVAITLHWLSALFVVVVGVLGLLHDSWPKGTQGFWINIHAVMGLLLWLILITRLSWRLQHPAPALPSDLGQISRRLSGLVHGLLYALMLVIPILGIITFIWHGRVFNLGLFQVDFGIKSNRSIFHPTEDIHGYLAYALFGLAGLHAAAALWHHHIRRDGLLHRMWPAASDRSSGR